jgi:hypothetical protein
MQKKTCLIIFLSFIFIQVFAQYENIEYYPILSKKSQLKASTVTTSNTSLVSLPFFDDFAYPSSTPLVKFWKDSYAYVNNSFATNSITIGTITLDALDENGALYPNSSTNAMISDYLTSQPINLKTYENSYASDKLFIKNGTYSLLTSDYYLFSTENNLYIPVTNGIIFQAGDTIYKKIGSSYISQQDSLYTFSTTYSYIDGSYSFEPKIHDYTLEDSLALSFYYQDGGLGDKPEAVDSLVLEFYVPYNRQGIFINEITADWIEIYNATDTIISLANWLVTTDTLQEILLKDSLETYRIGSSSFATISPYSHTIITANEIGKLSFTNTYLNLYSPDTILVDSVILFGTISQESSYGRIPDGNPIWSFSAISSPADCNLAWNHIWSTSSDTSDYFTRHYIPFTNTAYLQKGFRFRFKNYTSLSNDISHARNEDFWNLDMIWLDANRDAQNQDITDVAFVEKLDPLYSSFTTIPISHFASLSANDFRMTIDSKFINFD